VCHALSGVIVCVNVTVFGYARYSRFALSLYGRRRGTDWGGSSVGGNSSATSLCAPPRPNERRAASTGAKTSTPPPPTGEDEKKRDRRTASTRVVTSLYVYHRLYTRNILKYSRACWSGAMSGKNCRSLLFFSYFVSVNFFIFYSRVRSAQISRRPNLRRFSRFPTIQQYKIITICNDSNNNNNIGIWPRWNLQWLLYSFAGPKRVLQYSEDYTSRRDAHRVDA